jgi:CheY-like chemotaxis protein
MAQSTPKARIVMVVDDTADVRELMSMQLRLLGYEVVEATNGQEAVEVARQTCPALILMDIHMPVMDGLSAVRLIRNIKELCEVSIVAFSAFWDGINRQRALDAGCDEYVNKTGGINQLSTIVRRYLPAA